MTQIIAEIGINHNADIKTAFDLIDVAIDAGCDFVKFQKRVPVLSVPESQWTVPKETPWGMMPYIQYKKRLEFRETDYHNLHLYCKGHIQWFASCWDIPSVEFINKFSVPYIKIPSACLTNDELLYAVKETGKPIILSTGMSTIEQIDHAVEILENVTLMHCTSSYPAKPEELNLQMIPKLKERYGCRVGYSGHEVGLGTTLAAVALGAEIVERHITLDRSMWGTDQAASVEPQGLRKLVKDIRTLEKAMGNGVKRVYDSELPVLGKLRRA
jgi:N-acetylneuraminate synthase